jgi:hypothetical protein
MKANSQIYAPAAKSLEVPVEEGGWNAEEFWTLWRERRRSIRSLE